MEHDERSRRIAQIAYAKALARGLAPGHEIDDWLEAEREVDAARERDIPSQAPPTAETPAPAHGARAPAKPAHKGASAKPRRRNPG